MNERIQQLALQAGAETWSRAPMRAVTGLAFTDENLEKFAQLIVRECIAICKDIDGEEDAMAKCGRQDCAVEIREHFGVEK
jgi:hypothetical protein